MATIYVVTDIRTVVEGNAVIITSTQHSTRNGAEQQYHTKLAAAANPDSQYPTHAVILATNEGFVIDSKSYTHDIVPPEPEPEPEPTPEVEGAVEEG